MPYNDGTAGVSTLQAALEVEHNDTLRQLNYLLSTTERPTRKADLVASILRLMTPKALPALWNRLDTLQKAAVAEVVHSNKPSFEADRFKAKYGSSPDWGSAD